MDQRPLPETMADFFDARHDRYEEHMAQAVVGFERFYQAVARPIPETQAPLRILDIGCGTGLELKAIFAKAPGALITGIDVSWAMLKRLRETYVDRIDQLNLIQGSYLDLPLGEGVYDFVVAVMTLHHLKPPRKGQLYGRIRSALKTDGSYVEGDWVVSAREERRYLREYEQRVAGLPQAGGVPYHIDVPLSLPRQKRLLIRAGFSSVDVLWQEEGNSVYVARKRSADCD